MRDAGAATRDRVEKGRAARRHREATEAAIVCGKSNVVGWGEKWRRGVVELGMASDRKEVLLRWCADRSVRVPQLIG